MKDLFVTGTDTEVGKTVLAATLTAALDAIYWKPIQTGVQGGAAPSDRDAVARFAELPGDRLLPEAYVFDPPVSPHLAAERCGMTIDLATIRKPSVDGRRLVIEGAGGILVPVNGGDLMLDLARHLDTSLIIAARTTLGTINHTLLTVNAIRERGLDLLGVVMIGEENTDNRNAIERYGKVPVVGWIPQLKTLNRASLLEAFGSNFDRSCFD